MLPDLIWKSIKNEAFLKETYKAKKYIKQNDTPLKSLKSVIEKSKVNFPNFFLRCQLP